MVEDNFNIKPFLAEFIATFGLVFIAGMAQLQSDIGNITLLGVAITTFLVLSFMVYFSMPISGAHINPSITMSFVVTGRMEVGKGILYVFSQLIGSIIAAFSIQLLASDELLDAASGKSELGFPHLSSSYSPFSGMLLELIMTFFLVFVFWAVTVDYRSPSSIYGFAIGGTVAFNMLAGGPLTGAAMNPARVFGPALLRLDFAHHWIYWVGPMLGALLAAFLYKLVFLQSEE